MMTYLTPHPWSRDFSWTPRTGPFVRLTRDEAAHYDTHGFVVVEDALAPEVVAELLAHLDPLEARVDAFLRTQFPQPGKD